MNLQQRSRILFVWFLLACIVQIQRLERNLLRRRNSPLALFVDQIVQVHSEPHLVVAFQPSDDPFQGLRFFGKGGFGQVMGETGHLFQIEKAFPVQQSCGRHACLLSSTIHGIKHLRSINGTDIGCLEMTQICSTLIPVIPDLNLQNKLFQGSLEMISPQTH